MQHNLNVDRTRRSCDVMCMELTVQDAARIAQVSTRTTQRAIEDGRLGMARTIGRQTTTDDLAIQTWVRTTAPGRKWSSKVRNAALDLLSGGTADGLSSSERSRLRSVMRRMGVQQLAASSWVGVWARYRTLGDVAAPPIGPSAADPQTLGLIPGSSWVRFADTPDLDVFEASQPVTADPDGDLIVIERPHDPRLPRVLIDTYVLGDARESEAAAHELTGMLRAL